MWIKAGLYICLLCFGIGDADSRRGPTEFMAKVIQFASTVKNDPELNKLWHQSASTTSDSCMPDLPEFRCDTSSNSEQATTVHQLRPSDIKVIAAMGDSITAGNGLGAESILAVALQNRGESWDIGGDSSLDYGVLTLANVLRKFNPDLKGASVCISHESNTRKSWLNVAEAGAHSGDMVYQANLLVARCKEDQKIDFDKDWKLVTLFIGGNDFCFYCNDNPRHTPEAYRNATERALDILHDQLPKTFVNLVPVFDITPLNNFTDELCRLSHGIYCQCAVLNATEMKPLQNGYYAQLKSLVDSGKYDTKDTFTVVLQPMFVESTLPADPNTGEYCRSFLSPDCFHPSRRAHQGFAMSLWNTMLIPVGKKPLDVQKLENRWYCPTETQPFLFTAKNSKG